MFWYKRFIYCFLYIIFIQSIKTIQHFNEKQLSNEKDFIFWMNECGSAEVELLLVMASGPLAQPDCIPAIHHCFHSTCFAFSYLLKRETSEPFNWLYSLSFQTFQWNCCLWLFGGGSYNPFLLQVNQTKDNNNETKAS